MTRIIKNHEKKSHAHTSLLGKRSPVGHDAAGLGLVVQAHAGIDSREALRDELRPHNLRGVQGEAGLAQQYEPLRAGVLESVRYQVALRLDLRAQQNPEI